jgi:DsbC/DsbD-like thiol-disulfide interchange protein
MFSFRILRAAIGLLVPITMAVSAYSPAMAGSATSWVTKNHATTRLVVDTTSWKNQQKVLVAGIHIKLDDGWKTYWRYPGDSGLPPRFDWSGSVNLKSAKLLWPAPKRMLDSAGTSIGYKKEVVFPVVIEPVTADKPIILKLKMEYAVCADICIPAEADLQLKVGKAGFFSSSYASLLAHYLDQVPEKKAPGSNTGLGISHAVSQLTGKSPHLTIDARFPGGVKGADLFIEGPEGFYLAPAEPVGKPGEGKVRFKVDLTKGDDPKDLKGKSVTLTLVSKAAQAETTWRIE